MKHPHFCYGLLFAILLGIEVCIALFVHDAWIRPYFGDILVMCVLYAFLRMVIPIRVWKKLCTRFGSWWILLLFLFSVLVEILQGLHLVERLGLAGNAAASTILGTSFDWGDLLCYASGCAVLWVLEQIERRFLTDKML